MLLVKHVTLFWWSRSNLTWHIPGNSFFEKLLPRSHDTVSILFMELITGHDCLSKHLRKIRVFTSANCVFCSKGEEMYAKHLENCDSLKIHQDIVSKYWEARRRMTLMSNSWAFDTTTTIIYGRSDKVSCTLKEHSIVLVKKLDGMVTLGEWTLRLKKKKKSIGRFTSIIFFFVI